MPALAYRRTAVAVLICIGAFTGACYTRHAPLDEAPLPSHAAAPLPLTAGVRVSPSQALNAQRIHPTVVVERVAVELEKRRVFERVVFPHSALNGVAPDLEIEVLVGSRIDRRFLRNLIKQGLVGASLLLLQPLLPIEYDLEVEILARGRFADGPWEIEQRASRTRRLRYTWLQVSEGALRDWSEVTSEEAAVLLAEALAADPALRHRVRAVDQAAIR